MEASSGMYRIIVLERLKIGSEFLRENENIVHRRLAAAAEELERALDRADDGKIEDYFDNADFAGINQCLHLSSDILLLGSAPEDFKGTVSALRNEFHNQDVITILTIAVLYYLLDYETRRAAAKTPVIREELKNPLTDIYTRFDRLNWMIGTDAMRLLGISGPACDTGLPSDDRPRIE